MQCNRQCFHSLRHKTFPIFHLMSPSRHTRWSPTREQLMVLEELYTRGLRNPKALQIQSIITYLAGFGNIQAKNVFYWFQNHKARDRLKIRKKLQQLHLMQLHHFPNDQNLTNNYTHMIYFSPTPSALIPHCFSAHSIAPQAGETYSPYAAAAGQEKQAWWKDLRADSPTRTNGQDLMMIVDVGPTTACAGNRPLETLELFPLRPSNVSNQHYQTMQSFDY